MIGMEARISDAIIQGLAPFLQPPPEYWSIKRAARLGDLSYDHVRRAVESGELPAADKGNGQKRVWRIARGDFDRWMRQGRGGRHALPPRSELRATVEKYLPGL